MTKFKGTIIEIELMGKSVNAPKFLGVLEKEFNWFISYTLLLAEKHIEDQESKKIFIAVVLIGDYLWDLHTLRFEEVIYEKNRTRRQKIATPPQAIVEKVLAEVRAAYEKTKELPAQIKKRLKEAQELQAEK